jgi:hypothetical protein
MSIRGVAALLVAAGILSGYGARSQSGRILDCESTFPPDLTVAALEKTFGAQHVGTDQRHTPGDSGEVDEVTVLFPSTPENRVEIVWIDETQKRAPAQVWIRGERSRWKTRDGLTLGLDLRSVEALNGRPFLLAGFSFDYSGTQTSWRNGQLAAPTSSPCGVRVVFVDPPDGTPGSRQVLGGRQFSSGHPAMQAINPRIEKLWLEYR